MNAQVLPPPSIEVQPAPAVPLLAGDASRTLVWDGAEPVDAATLLARASALSHRIAGAGEVVNLCEDRGRYLLGFVAALLAGRTTLMPPSRASEVVRDVLAAHPCAVAIDDAFVDAAIGATAAVADVASPVLLPAARVAAIGFTSGSTGQPREHRKRWGSFAASTALNLRAMQALAGAHIAGGCVVATVPPQHMYGMETSVLLPLLGGLSVHAARPLFPASVARALDEVDVPRVLVSTPVHLRALVDSGERFPDVALILSATAPLDAALAARVEERLRAPLLELFGSTETCVIATRRTAADAVWRTYPGVALQPGPDGTRVSAAWIEHDTWLQDMIVPEADGGFRVGGRHTDMIEIAGKRASLAELNARLKAIDGVLDAVFVPPEPDAQGRVSRLAALVVAPGLSAAAIRERLRESVDPAFLPRPLRMMDALPRNDVGKLPRAALLVALRGTGAATDDATA